MSGLYVLYLFLWFFFLNYQIDSHLFKSRHPPFWKQVSSWVKQALTRFETGGHLFQGRQMPVSNTFQNNNHLCTMRKFGRQALVM